MPITGKTRVFMIIGDPVAQVRAPEVYNHLFALHGVDAVVVPVKVPAAQLAGFVRHAFEAENLGGFWVTIPHKAAMHDLMQICDPVAQTAGAVNAVRRSPQGGLEGALFDGLGFVKGLDHFGIDVAGRQVLVVGAGGGGQAVAAALAQRGPARLAIANRSTPKAQALVDRLLAPHRKPHVVSDVNIHEVCERVRSLILAEFPKGLAVRRDYDISIPDFRGDREQLIQAVLNIAHNAAQALSERISQGDAQLILRTRVSRQVTIGKQRYRLALELHIEDNGPGVPEDIRDRIFYPLISGREGGSGLGLTLAQTFVQQHQGTIECDSVPGKTVFRIVIPLP